MGLALVKYAEINNQYAKVNCKVDADCYKANTKVGTGSGWPAITTDADKKKTCC
jgi:peptide methionine sulfoxide reductase MsrB